MVILSEANALLDLTTKAHNLVQAIGSTYYKNSQDFQSFAKQVRALRSANEDWTRLLNRYGPAAQELVRPTLEAAMDILEEEDASIRYMQSNCWLRCSYRTLNIGAASLAIQDVSQAFETIPRTIERHVEADQLLSRIATSAVAPLPFISDNKYVPFPKPLEEVKRALENVGGPRVVTLHGQPGSGKTVMAKYLAIYYDKLRQEPIKPTSLRAAQTSNCFSDGVFFLACGPGVSSKGLLEELWQNLGFRAIFDVDTQGASIFIPRVDQEWYSESMLRKQLAERLVGTSVLIILDDVWETQLLERLLIPGSSLKYLVTSQNKRVWDDAAKINIAKPSLEEARKILVNHVDGLPVGTELPLNLQDVADMVIHASEFNPLVLANLALAISGDRATDLDEWITINKYLLELLDADDKRPGCYEKIYHQTVASTMTMAVNSMTVETKNLLFLVAVCDGPSVPEIVLKILFKGLVGSLARFQKWSNYLQDHGFIQIQSHDVEWTDVPQKTWSLHFLRQHFVREEKKDDVRSMVSALFGAKHKDLDIVSALYILYATKSYTRENAATVSGSLSISRDRTNESFARSSIEPFVWLLHADSNEEWKQSAHEMAKKIIVNYVCCGHLEDNSLSRLLRMPKAQSATCWALYTIAILEQRAMLTEKHEETLKSLLALMDPEATPKTQGWGAVAAGALAVKNYEIILAQPLALKNLLGLVLGGNLVGSDYENVQRLATWTLGNLAATSASRDIIANYPRMLDALLKVLNTNDYHDVQVEAAYVLRRLAYDEETTIQGQSRQMKMIALPGMLQKIVDLLSSETDSDVQKEVVWLLGNLAASRKEKLIIGDYPGVLEGLVIMLNIQDVRFDAQRYHAAYALRRLTLKEPNPKLGLIPCAIEYLVELLFVFGSDVQKEAVHCLSFLTYPKEHRVEFAAIPSALEGLVGLLEKGVSPTTQLIATGTLANLVEIDENKLLIASEPGAIEGLVRILRNTGDPPEIATDAQLSVQSQLSEVAVQCLGQLSFENYENQLRIASSPDALEALLKLLGSSNSRVQLLVVWTLSNLAEAVENRTRIIASPNAENLIGLLKGEGLESEIKGYAEKVISLLNSTAPLMRIPGLSVQTERFSKTDTTTDNGAIEDQNQVKPRGSIVAL